MIWKVPQFESSVGDAEAEAAAMCIRSGWITEGPKCAEFVERLKELAGVKYGVLAPNGTLALYMALKACSVERAAEVLVPDLTFAATASAVLMAGSKPVFVDVNERGQMSAADAKRKMTMYTEAYIPVHLYGLQSDEVPCSEKFEDFWCIEDACQGLGVKHVDGKPCGSFGDASAFSFFADKTITTGEGGFVGTNDEDIYERLLYLRNQGRIDRGSFIHQEVGQNFRMTDIQAAVGLVQLDRFGEIRDAKLANHARYREGLRDLSAKGCRLLEALPGSTMIPFRTIVFFKERAKGFAMYLESKGIEARSAFYPLHLQPAFRHLQQRDGGFPGADYFWEHSLCLPNFYDMANWQVDHVCSTIEDFLKGARAYD